MFKVESYCEIGGLEYMLLVVNIFLICGGKVEFWYININLAFLICHVTHKQPSEQCLACLSLTACYVTQV